MAGKGTHPAGSVKEGVSGAGEVWSLHTPGGGSGPVPGGGADRGSGGEVGGDG